MQQLKRVSLTGVDDKTNIDDLVTLSEQFSFVEWAMLYVPHNEGAPRNPTAIWRNKLISAQPKGYLATHLCGDLAFRQLFDDELPADIRLVNRIQLNINARYETFNTDEVLEVYRRSLLLGPDIILQHNQTTAAPVQLFLSELKDYQRDKIHILFDESRGTGTVPDSWSLPPELEGAFYGFAGGINPDNVISTLEQVKLLGTDYWIDMESGIREDNQFSIEKARRVLQATEQYLKG